CGTSRGNLGAPQSVVGDDMNPRPSIFLAQIIFIAVLTLFHAVTARMAWRRIPGNYRIARRMAGLVLLLAIVLLDLPLVHMFVFYKFFHPLVLDRLMHDWAGPFLALHA